MQWDKSLQKKGPEARNLESCSGCGAQLPGGSAGCRELFNELLARDYANALYASVHMTLVDCHALQHPQDHGVKNNAFHLLSLCWQLEHSREGAVPPAWIRKQFDGNPAVPQLDLPSDMGQVTIADVYGSATPTEHAERVRHWAASVWEAWRVHQPWARRWIVEHARGRSLRAR